MRCEVEARTFSSSHFPIRKIEASNLRETRLTFSHSLDPKRISMGMRRIDKPARGLDAPPGVPPSLIAGITPIRLNRDLRQRRQPY